MDLTFEILPLILLLRRLTEMTSWFSTMCDSCGAKVGRLVLAVRSKAKSASEERERRAGVKRASEASAEKEYFSNSHVAEVAPSHILTLNMLHRRIARVS